jgi:hypothetical protein
MEDTANPKEISGRKIERFGFSVLFGVWLLAFVIFNRANLERFNH